MRVAGRGGWGFWFFARRGGGTLGDLGSGGGELAARPGVCGMVAGER